MATLIKHILKQKSFSRQPRWFRYGPPHLRASFEASPRPLSIQDAKLELKRVQKDLQLRSSPKPRMSPCFLAPPRRPLARTQSSGLFEDGVKLELSKPFSHSTKPAPSLSRFQNSTKRRLHRRPVVPESPKLFQRLKLHSPFSRQSPRKFLPLGQAHASRFVSTHHVTELNLKFKRSPAALLGPKGQRSTLLRRLVSPEG